MPKLWAVRVLWGEPPGGGRAKRGGLCCADGRDSDRARPPRLKGTQSIAPR